MDASETMSQSAYAEKRSVSRQYINKLVGQGKLPVDADKQILVAEADAVFDSGNVPPDEGPHSAAFATSQARKADADANLAELKYAKAIGTVVDKEEAEHAAHELFGDLRERLVTQLPPKIAPLLAAKTDERDVLWALRTALEAELTEFAIDLNKKFAADVERVSSEAAGAPDGGDSGSEGVDAAPTALAQPLE